MDSNKHDPWEASDARALVKLEEGQNSSSSSDPLDMQLPDLRQQRQCRDQDIRNQDGYEDRSDRYRRTKLKHPDETLFRPRAKEATCFTQKFTLRPETRVARNGASYEFPAFIAFFGEDRGEQEWHGAAEFPFEFSLPNPWCEVHSNEMMVQIKLSSGDSHYFLVFGGNQGSGTDE
jgi:hypothetical protein